MNIAKPAIQQAPPKAGLKPWDIFGAAAFLIIAIEFYLALIWVPADLIEGQPYRIVYVHVPMITVSYVAFLLVFVSSLLYLWRRRPIFDIFARSSAEVGFFFLTLVILSGGLWGEATWGTFWQWEPRLTFTFILWLIFLGYLMLRTAADNKERMARYCAVVGILGFLDIPMVSASVYLWRGLHPEPTIPPAQIGYTLLVGFLGFFMLFAYLLNLRFRIDRTQIEADELRADLEEQA